MGRQGCTTATPSPGLWGLVGYTGKALQRVARLPRSSKRASPTGTVEHQALGCGDHWAHLVGHYILCHTCIKHSWCSFTQVQPVWRYVTQMKTCGHPIPASNSHPPPLTQPTPPCTQRAGSGTGRIQAPSEHRLLYTTTKLLPHYLRLQPCTEQKE